MRNDGSSRAWSAMLLGAAAAAAAGAIYMGAGFRGGSRVAVTSPAASPPTHHATVEGPFVHENLAVYLVRGADRLDLDGVIGLAQALDQGKAVVRETGDVQSLVVENLGDQGVFVEAGDIVKGGRQDRVLTTDLLLPPKSGPIGIDAFCVEQGRWSARGDEPPARFASSDEALPTRKLKLAAKQRQDQGAVWAEVAALQEKLAVAAAEPVRAPASSTSLQLTLESPAVEQGVRGYLEALDARPAARDDVVGFVFAINGEVVSADVYGAAELARKRWPKLLRAAAVEAFADRADATGARTPPPTDAVAKVLVDAEREAALAAPRSGAPAETVVSTERAKYQLLESRGESSKMLHRSLVLRDDA